MRFKQFLLESDNPIPEELPGVTKQYFSPKEVMSKSQWRAIYRDEDFLKHLFQDGRIHKVMVKPDPEYHNIFDVSSTSALDTTIRFALTREGDIYSKTIYKKSGKDKSGKPQWITVKTWKSDS